MARTENLTIMFTDIADFSEAVAKMSRDESEQMLRVHDMTLHKIIRNFQGKWVKSIGDSFLVVFRSPTDAALCAMAMHDALWELGQSQSDKKKITIRVALNLGEVRLTRNDVFGEAVNIASRLESITPAKEVYLTEAVYLSMNKAEVNAVEVDSHKFKGSPEKIKYYKIPRGISRRVVETETEDAEQNFNYPFGGAHLKAEAEGRSINLEPFFAFTDKVKLMLSDLSSAVNSYAREKYAATLLHSSNLKKKLIAQYQTKPAYIYAGAACFLVLTALAIFLATGSPNEPSTEAEQTITVMDTTEIAQRETQVTDEIKAQAKALFKERDFQGLKILIQESAEKYPDNAYVIMLQGHLYMRNGSYARAMKSYKQAVASDPQLAKNKRLAANVVDLLEYQRTASKTLMRENLSKEIIAELGERTGKSGLQGRYDAFYLLKNSGNIEHVDRVGLNIWDLKELEKCTDKKVSVKALRQLKSPRALPALKESINVKFIDRIRYGCLRKEAKAAIREIQASNR